MKRVFVISKPYAPPWRDSSKNLARELVRHSLGYRYRVLGSAQSRPPQPHITVEPIYRGSGAFEPGLRQNLRVLRRLFGPARADLYHFFFAPSRRTAQAASLALRLSLKRRPSVQTLCSLPPESVPVRPGLFADAVVVLSRYAQDRLRDEGFSSARFVAPCVRQAPPVASVRRRQIRQLLGFDESPLLLFAGDVEPARGASTFVRAIPAVLDALKEAQFVVAARAKTARSLAFENSLRQQVEALGVKKSVHFLGETAAVRALLACSDVQILPATSLEKKMDYPLILLEGLARGLPIVVSDQPPLAELLDGQRQQAGKKVRPNDPQAVAQAIVELCADRETLDQARQAARLAAQDFAPEAMVKAYENLYAELLGDRGSII